MKPLIVIELLKLLQQKPHLKRKLKVFAVIGVVILLMVGGGILYAGFTAATYLLQSAQQLAQTSEVQGRVTQLAPMTQLEGLKRELTGITARQVALCLQKTQALVALQPWIDRPASENISGLIATCTNRTSSESDGESDPCEGPQCGSGQKAEAIVEGGFL